SRGIQISEKINLSSTTFHGPLQWLKNADFNSTDFWSKTEEGDITDLDGNIENGVSNYFVFGDKGEIKIDNPLNESDWTAYKNPKLPILPDTYVINKSGGYVQHFWNENINQTRNRPSVQWKRLITMPVNMSDYLITSASLTVIFNATVQALDHDGGGIDREGDANLDDYSSGDYAEFYVLISGQEENLEPIQVAYNRTSDLGRDTPTVTTYYDTPMNIVPESVLMSVLTSFLGIDNYNFTITLGIDIYCEDNELGVDQDRWRSLIINSFNLTFTYEKKINQFNSVSWSQTGNSIQGNNVQIIDAIFNFDYKINESWVSSLSPNSEIRMLINNKYFDDAIKLSLATSIFQTAKIGGFKIEKLIQPYINISVSIQLYIADEFILDHDLNISIDNVFLEISYIEYFQDFLSEPEVFRILLIISIIAASLVGSYFIAYYKVLRYPIPVRKVRKYNKNLDDLNPPSVQIIERKESFKVQYKNELNKTNKFLKVKSIEQEPGAINLKDK
ncbi:MAG: hypothetical protein ACFFFB_09610, partial [Candidatus Heimdallarchaeota archaeon]